MGTRPVKLLSELTSKEKRRDIETRKAVKPTAEQREAFMRKSVMKGDDVCEVVCKVKEWKI